MSDLLSVGKTGLFSSKKALETTGHNLANTHTDGYSRQRVNVVNNDPVQRSGLVEGTGSRVTAINRIHDPFIQKRINQSTAQNEFFDTRYQQLSEVENIFNEVNGDGLSQILGKFFNSFRELSNHPEDETMRSVVRDNAQMVVKDFNRISKMLETISQNIDHKFEVSVSDINSLTSSIADLNQKIKNIEVIGHETGDLRDQRDIKVKELAKYFKLDTYLDNKNQFVVNVAGVGTLVSGTQAVPLQAASINEEHSTNSTSGSRELFFAGRPANILTNKFQEGSLGSLAKARNIDIKQLQEKIDQLAFDFTNAVNAIHTQGFANRPVAGNLTANLTGINFFAPLNSKKNAAATIDLSKEIQQDLTNIATALVPNAPGDNRIALGISKLQHEKILLAGTTTLEEFYLQVVGKIGLEVGKAHLDHEQSSGILAQTNSIRERISGVSIDEETANMIKFQHAYDASAKVLKTAEEMFQTVLGLKG